VSDEEEIDTGFDDVLAGNVYVAPPVTATVSDKPEVIAEPVPDNTKAIVQLPEKLDAVMLAKLAREIAMDIKEKSVVLKECGLTQEQYDYLAEHSTFFKYALETAALEWQSPLSTKERVAVAAAAILEDSLPTLGGRMQNRGEGLPGVTETAKLFAKLAGIGERENSGPPTGERFVINIDLGGDQKVTLQAGDVPQASPPSRQLVQPHQDHLASPHTGVTEIQPEPQTTGSPTPVQQEPKGS